MLTVALGLLAALVVLATLVRLLEPRFAFFPMAGESVTPRDFGVDYDSAAVRTRDGERLRSWSLAGPAARARIIYFHGNGGNLSMWAPIMAESRGTNTPCSRSTTAVTASARAGRLSRGCTAMSMPSSSNSGATPRAIHQSCTGAHRWVWRWPRTPQRFAHRTA